MCEEAYVMQHLFLITAYSLDSMTSAMYYFALPHLIPCGLVLAEIKRMLPVAPFKLKLISTSSAKQAPRGYCQNMCIVLLIVYQHLLT